jgi:hypothetical protein
MFATDLAKIRRRKERLIGRTEAQRAAMADAWRYWQQPAHVVDRGIAVARFLKSHPLLLGVGVTAAVVLGRRNLLGWISRGWVVWRTFRSLRAWAGKAGIWPRSPGVRQWPWTARKSSPAPSGE